MSISLVIMWNPENSEVIDFASTQGVRDGWVPLARQLGHELTTEMAGYLPVTPSNINRLYSEVTELREAIAFRMNAYGDLLAVDKLLDGLHRLQISSGWSASIGS